MEPKFFDIHAHVQFPQYDDDREEVMARAHESGTWMINVGTKADTSEAAIALADEYADGVYATAGLHPTHTNPTAGREVESFDQARYRALAAQPKVVAIGECGLDYYRADESSKKEQQAAFEAQIELAGELDKPLMLHIRDAYADALAVLKNHPHARGDVHFFAGNTDEARAFLDRGFTLSFTGVVTFTHDYDDVVRSVPRDMLMSETDAPYVAPVPHRGARNEPSFVEKTVRRLAEIRGEAAEELAPVLVGNARRVFGV